MDTLIAPPHRASPHRPRPRRQPRERWRHRMAGLLHEPVLGWVGVLLVATLSFYVHVLERQVERGEAARASARSEAAAQTPAAPVRQPPLRVGNRVVR